MTKKSRCFRGPALLAISLTLALAAQAALYVSPAGDDANPGTAERPVRTLAHARDLARELIPSMHGDLTIWLAGGVYRLGQPLVFGPEDSGANGHDVIYAAQPGARPVLSGGVRITGWKQVDAARNLWAAPAPATLVNTRQLYIDGVRARRTRGRLPVTLTETPTGYTASSPLLSHWRNPADIEFVYTGGNALWSERSVGLGAWTEPRCPVARIDGATILMAQPCWDNSTKRVMLPRSSGFHRTANLVGPASIGKEPAYVENAYELLGTPGQWYFDRAARLIYYVPRAGESLATADVEAPVLETLVAGRGSPAAPVHNLVFKGLQFSYATWLFPSSPEGFSEIQANYLVTGPDGYATQGLGGIMPGGTQPYGAWTPTPGNVAFICARHVQFLGDAFVHLGAAGLQLGQGAQDDTVAGCVFTDISGNGLDLGGVAEPEAPPAAVTRDNRVLDNHLCNIAAEYHGGVAICVGYAQRTLIAHNQIDHLPYAAISMGWGGWPDKIHRAGVANNSRDNVVADNLIFDHMRLLADGGGIYTQGLTGPSLAEGEKVTGNVVRDQFSTGHAIYSDNGSCNLTIARNVMFHTNHDNWGSRHGDYYDGNDGRAHDPLIIADNWWQQGDRDSDEKNVVVRGNRLISALDQAPAEILRNAGLEPAARAILGERFGAPAAPEPPQRVAATAGDGFALVAWNPPCFEGGAPVESYTVTSSRGEQATISAANFNAFGCVKLTGLADGAACAFTVTATNAHGVSAPSLPSAAVTPSAREIHPPGEPVRVFAYAADGIASIHIQAPRSDGGSPVLAYVFTVHPGERKILFAGRAALTLGGTHVTFGVVDGLQAGQTYTFDVAALNAAGLGAAATTEPVTLAAK